jgi:hypothetical protein
MIPLVSPLEYIINPPRSWFQSSGGVDLQERCRVSISLSVPTTSILLL